MRISGLVCLSFYAFLRCPQFRVRLFLDCWMTGKVIHDAALYLVDG